jgi:hypothetical protein
VLEPFKGVFKIGFVLMRVQTLNQFVSEDWENVLPLQYNSLTMNKDCSHCIHKAFEMSKGLSCSLTGEKPATYEGCASYEPDLATIEIEEHNKTAVPPSNLSEFVEQTAEDTEKVEMQPLDRRHLILGILAGLGVGLVMACLWALFTALTDRQYGFMPILIGLLVGAVVRRISKNDSITMAAIAAVIAFASCFIGDFLTSVHYIAQSEELSYFETLRALDWKYFFEIATLGFNAISGLFYLFAIGEAFTIVRGKKNQKV